MNKKLKPNISKPCSSNVTRGPKPHTTWSCSWIKSTSCWLDMQSLKQEKWPIIRLKLIIHEVATNSSTKWIKFDYQQSSQAYPCDLRIHVKWTKDSNAVFDNFWNFRVVKVLSSKSWKHNEQAPIIHTPQSMILCH